MGRMPKDLADAKKLLPKPRVTGTSAYGWFSECGRFRLTFMQKKFCDTFLASGLEKPGEALLEAGYKQKTAALARRKASELLKNPSVREYLQLMRPKYEGKLLLTRDYVIAGLQEIVSGSRNDNAKVSALKHLGQYLGMWVERTEVTGKDGQPVTFADASSDLSGLDDATLRQVKALLSARKTESDDEPGVSALN